MGNVVKVSEAVAHSENPFLKDGVLKVDKANKTILMGGTKDVVVNMETGATEGITMLHKFKEVDRTQFVKLYTSEIQSLFDLSQAGLKVFGYVVQCMRIKDDTIYINVPDLKEFCGYKQTKQVYRGLAELIANQVIAKSSKSNIWFINPSVIFNGDRIAFIKEYRLKEKAKVGEQMKLELGDKEDI